MGPSLGHEGSLRRERWIMVASSPALSVEGRKHYSHAMETTIEYKLILASLIDSEQMLLSIEPQLCTRRECTTFRPCRSSSSWSKRFALSTYYILVHLFSMETRWNEPAVACCYCPRSALAWNKLDLPDSTLRPDVGFLTKQTQQRCPVR